MALKQTFTHSEMQNLIEQLNALQVNGEQVLKASEGNWKMGGMYLTIESDRNVAHIFLPLTPKAEEIPLGVLGGVIDWDIEE